MFPLVGIPKTIVKFLQQYRNVFSKEAGFQQINCYINFSPFSFTQLIIVPWSISVTLAIAMNPIPLRYIFQQNWDNFVWIRSWFSIFNILASTIFTSYDLTISFEGFQHYALTNALKIRPSFTNAISLCCYPVSEKLLFMLRHLCYGENMMT